MGLNYNSSPLLIIFMALLCHLVQEYLNWMSYFGEQCHVFSELDIVSHTRTTCESRHRVEFDGKY